MGLPYGVRMHSDLVQAVARPMHHKPIWASDNDLTPTYLSTISVLISSRGPVVVRKIIEGAMLAVVILCLIVGAWIAYLTLTIIGRG